MTLNDWLTTTLPGISIESALAVLQLNQEGATIPFIARYRKERTKGLDEVQIQNVLDAHEKYTQIIERQTFILKEIERQGKLTDELKASIQNSWVIAELDDLYLPYKVKRKSKAQLAREAGLSQLADWIWGVGHNEIAPEPGQTLAIWAFTFKNEAKGFSDAESCIQGATDLLVERLSEDKDLRAFVRKSLLEQGFVVSEKSAKAKPNSKFEMYFQFRDAISALLKPENSHRYLAIRRGWVEEELTIAMGASSAEQDWDAPLVTAFEQQACSGGPEEIQVVLKKAAKVAYRSHVKTSIENEIYKDLKELADQTAIQVFAQNVRKLLLSAPFGPKAVLGIDPGIRTGCKVAVVNDRGAFVADTVIHLQTDDQKVKAKELIKNLLSLGQIQAIAIGNGTGGRETEVFIRQTVQEAQSNIPVLLVNEAGASVYSASEVARDEFPDLDITVRGAISIARRLQDPLAELVKIDPKSIGVGQYQHDVAPGTLKKALETVVDSCVNSVGVNLNTASKYLLSRVSGIGESLAAAIVEFRKNKGLILNRKDLLNVPRFSSKTFEQAAGFLRIPEGSSFLDQTGVHPESYDVLFELADKFQTPIEQWVGPEGVRKIRSKVELYKTLTDRLGQYTTEDVLKELEKPGRDLRAQFVPFSFRTDLFDLKDVQPGMICPGIVTNVTSFGAFVDIGVHQDGLIHLSQLSNRFIKDAREVVQPGDRVSVKVLEVNLEKKQLAFTLKFDVKPIVSEGPKVSAQPRSSVGPRPIANDDSRNSAPRPRPRVAPNSAQKPGVASRPNLPKTQELKHNPFASLANLRIKANQD